MFSNKQNLIFLATLILVGLGLVWYFKPVFNDGPTSPIVSDILQESLSENTMPTPNLTPLEQTTLPWPQETPRPSPKTEISEPFLGLNGVKSPAACQVYGEIEFTSNDSFISRESKISWQNIDSRGRLIKWHVNPDDKLIVGPNIFESLPIPEGQYQNLTVRLPAKPIAKTYLLTASVTYGQFVKGNLEVKETNCTGTIKVNLNF